MRSWLSLAVLAVLVLWSGPGAPAASEWSEPVTDADLRPPEGTVETPSSPATDRRSTSSAQAPERAPAGQELCEMAARPHGSADLNVTYRYRRLPDRRGTVGVTMRIPETPGVESASVAFGDAISVVSTTNLTRNGSAYEWTGERAAEVTYRLAVDWTYAGRSTESWTLVEHRSPSVDTEPGVERRERLHVVGEGYVGNRTVLLGDHEVYDRRADGQTIEVVVPDSVSLLYGPNRTADALANASRALRIGARDDTLHAFATPEIETEADFLVQPGFALDGSTLLVDADSELDVWTHEYVHTRQAFSDAERLQWLTEASAEYYGWLLSIRQGYDGWGALRGVLSSARGDESVLGDPETWSGESDYRKGALVLAALDRAVRTATDGERTLQDVLRRVNGAGTDPTLETLVDAVREVGGTDAAAAAERYVTTNATPAYQPSRDRLAADYGYAAPRVQKRVVDVSAVGPNYTRRLDPSVTPRLAPDESLRVTARVRNAGDADGIAVVAPRVSDRDGELTRVDEPWVGRVRAGQTVIGTATHRFDQPGTYELGSALPNGVAVVPDRGTAAAVTGLNATRNRTTDDRVTIAVTVRNDGDRRTFVRRPVVVDGRRVATVALAVDAGAIRTVIRSVAVGDRSSAQITVGAASATVAAPATDPQQLTDPQQPTDPQPTNRPSVATDASGTERGRLPSPVLAALCVFAVAGLAGLWLRSRR